MQVPSDNLYTKNHEWVSVKDNIAVIGITDFAQDKLGDIIFVELPNMDIDVEREEAFAVVESTKNASDIYSPLDGKVIEINEALEDSPETINEDPFGDGWICKLEIGDDGQLSDLMTADEYQDYIEKSEEEED